VVQSAAGFGHSIPAATTLVSSPFFTQAGGFSDGTLSFFLFFSANAFVTGADYDANNDGLLDNLPSGSQVLDDVALLDNNKNAAGDITYGAAVVSEWNSTGTPDAATRFVGNIAPSSSAAWYGGDLVDTGNVASQLYYDATRESANEPAGWYLTPGGVNVPLWATVTWTGGAGTNRWSDVANWSSGTVPGASNQVVINGPGPLTIDHAAGNDTIYNLTSLGSQVVVDFTGGSLTLLANSTVNGQVNNSAALIVQGGTLALNGGGNDVGGSFVAEAGASLIIGGAVSLDGSTTIGGPGSISFNGITTQVGTSGPALQLPAAIHAAGPSSLMAAVSMPNAGTTVDTAGFGMTLGSQVSGGGTGGLTKTGAGTLTLSTADSYAGGTMVLGGTLLVACTGALPDGGSLTIGPSAKLVFGSSAPPAGGSVIAPASAMAVPAAARVETASPDNSAPLAVPQAQSATPAHKVVNPFAIPACSFPIGPVMKPGPPRSARRARSSSPGCCCPTWSD
jgi:autotransporter-associated beta strand protein